MRGKCPACDCESGLLSPLDSFALGIALGAGFRDETSKLCCPMHKTKLADIAKSMAIAMQEKRPAWLPPE